MSKKIAVIIRKDNKTLGNKNSVIKVAQGYAFNYLIPNKLADLATPGRLKHLQMLKQIEQSKSASETNKALITQKYLEKVAKISIQKQVGEKQQIFGSIGDKEIINQIKNYTGIILDKKQILLPEIKNAGTYILKVQILNDVYTNLKLQILSSEIQTCI